MRISTLKTAMAILGATVLAGCSLLSGGRDPARQFLAVTEPQCGQPAAVALAVQVHGSGFYDTQRIAYSKTPGTRQFYQYSLLTDRSFELLQRFLNQYFERVAEPALRPAVTLRVFELYHDATSEPGELVVTGVIEGEQQSPTPIKMRQPVATYDARGVAEAIPATVCQLANALEAFQVSSHASAPAVEPDKGL